MWPPFRRAVPTAAQPGPLRWREMPGQFSVQDLVITIGAGFVAFLLTGYLGYHDQPYLAPKLFQPPSILYLWICFILLLIVVRHPSAKGGAVVPAAALITSVALVALFYIDQSVGSHTITDGLLRLLPQILQNLTGGRFLINLLNFGVLLWWAVTVLLSWWRRYGPGAQQPAVLTVGAGVTNPSESSTGLDPHQALHGELISGDLLAGAALAGFFALLFSPSVFGLLQTLAPRSTPILSTNASGPGAAAPFSATPTCATTLPIHPCPPPDPHHPPAYITLTFLDVRIAFVLVAIGGLWLITISAIKAFRSATIERLLIEMIRTMLAALGRLIGLRFLGLVKAFWLPAILFAPVAAVFASQFIWCNLHLLGNDQLPQRCGLVQPTALNPLPAVIAVVLLTAVLSAVSLVPQHAGRAPLDLLGQLSGVLVFILVLAIVFDFARTTALGIIEADRYVLSAIAWLLIAMLALIWGLGLWLGRWDVITQSLSFLAFLSWIVVAIFWVFSMILSGADALFVTAPGAHHPFQLNDSTWFSLGAFVVTVAYILVRRPFGSRPPPSGRSPQRGAPAGSQPAAVAPPADKSAHGP